MNCVSQDGTDQDCNVVISQGNGMKATKEKDEPENSTCLTSSATSA